MTLDDLYQNAANLCLAKNLPIDDSPNGPIAAWARANCTYRPETEFFIVLGICGAMADKQAQAQGFESSSHRAAAIASAKFPPKPRRGLFAGR